MPNWGGKDNAELRRGAERRIEYKRGYEINPIRMRPHPIEFSMYFDA